MQIIQGEMEKIVYYIISISSCIVFLNVLTISDDIKSDHSYNSYRIIIALVISN